MRSVLLGCLLAWIFAGTLAAAADGPKILQNGEIRLELDPRSFSVRFVGFPGGTNFVDPAHASPPRTGEPGEVEPGGVTTDLLPPSGRRAPMRRGPAEVVEHSERYILLLGPEHPEKHWRVKKEYHLPVDRPEVRYKVTVLSARKEERRIGVRTTAQVPPAGRFEIPGEFGALGLLRGDYPGLASVMAEGAPSYTLPLKEIQSGRALLAVPAPEIAVVTPHGHWIRRVELQSAAVEPKESPNRQALVLLDGKNHVYQAGLEARQRGVNVGSPLVVVEHWTFSRPGAKEEAE